MNFDSSNPSDWLNLRVGSTISLSDMQSLLENKKQTGNLAPLDCRVERVSRLRETNGLVTWALVNLEASGVPLVLVAKRVDQNVDFYVYFQSPDFAPTTRLGALDNGNFWLFQQPNDENNFNVGDLFYTKEITQTFPKGQVVFTIKGQGELNADVTESPARTGLTNLLATLVEYNVTDADMAKNTENPEAIILEIGNKDNADGGEIVLLLGNRINVNEVQVLGL